jgi:transcriptional regulator with XRE-family HTH domain
MKSLLGACLRDLRAGQSRLKFAKQIGLSYTFVREMELGNRLPSDEVLFTIASRLSTDPRRLVLCAYCDRSPALRIVLTSPNLSELLTGLGVAEK